MGWTKWLIATAAAIATIQTAAAGDAELGAKLFNACKACHDIASPQKKVGPSLQHVMGRKAGAVEGFTYSDAMKNSGLTWDEATLKAYLADPKGKIPGNKMPYAGMKKPDDLDNLLAYLAEAGK
jgi:cytochrome c